jgi:acetoin utilization deacetylase AcuC-like enzyme
MDLYEGDPLGKFKITRAGIRQIGQAIAALKLPTLIVQEGGYNNDDLGANLVALLENFA